MCMCMLVPLHMQVSFLRHHPHCFIRPLASDETQGLNYLHFLLLELQVPVISIWVTEIQTQFIMTARKHFSVESFPHPCIDASSKGLA